MKKVISALALTVSAMTVAPASQAQEVYRAVSSGPGEAVPVASPGYSIATFDIAGNILTADIPFSDLVSPTAAAHLHCCTTEPMAGTAGVAIDLFDFPLGVNSGTYSQSFDLLDPGIYSAAFLGAFGGTAAGASAAMLDALSSNQVYLNIHTSQYPVGEIRGFLVNSAVAPIPEPATWGMLGAGLAGLAILSRRRPALVKQA
ncbi:CHRD domain-containing protein [Massilia sp. H6]|uniref:CHRD domain-containing protein n=1 Tax=Massilia sp. H6 TaxID=2970464 RepID=UPI0021672D88|nr:CHRD domain-containing protein [Massilia sp. H6]UVW27674.1 CHRD domain-containing protein [Massilia sp. H6]